MRTPHLWRSLLVLLVALLALAPQAGRAVPVAAASLTFTVNSTADTNDVNPGDGLCADSSGQCTLRAATQEADAQPTGSSITINVPAGTYGLTLGTLQLTANAITISGALSSTTIISGNNTSTVMAISHTVQASLSQLTLTGGKAVGPKQAGGGLLNAGLTVLSQSTLISNTASYGGGVVNAKSGRLWLVGCTINGNSATGTHGGGGIWNRGTLSVTTSTLSGNSASGSFSRGGGIYNDLGSTVTLTTSTLSGNSALGGGGIFNYGTLSVTTSTLSGNSASDNRSNGAGGGGIDNTGTLTVIDSTLVGNSAPWYGGGILNQGSLNLTNSTLSRNTTTVADNAGGGGGIYTALGTVTLTNSTLSGNSAPFGGGITIYYGMVTLTNTILAGNNGGIGADCWFLAGTVHSGGYNLVGIGYGCPGLTNGVNGDQVGSSSNPLNPLLGPLQDNGGPTQTMALLPGSSAIDPVPAAHCPLTTDQRGMPRPDEPADSGTCDMGAYESQGIG